LEFEIFAPLGSNDTTGFDSGKMQDLGYRFSTLAVTCHEDEINT
jgi:hypothetical protein